MTTYRGIGIIIENYADGSPSWVLFYDKNGQRFDECVVPVGENPLDFAKKEIDEFFAMAHV